MIYYYFGDDAEKLYTKRIEYHKQNFLIFNSNDRNLFTEILTKGFFEEDKKLIIDLSRECENLVIPNYEKLKKISEGSVLVFFSIKEDKKLLSISDKKEKFSFSRDSDIFKLLDGLYCGNIKTSLSLYDKYKNQGLENYVFSMLFFPIKNILLFLFDKPAFAKLHPFVAKKAIELNAKIGGNDNLMKIIYFLSQADVKIKMGSSQKNIFISYIMYLKLLLENVETAPIKKI